MFGEQENETCSPNVPQIWGTCYRILPVTCHPGLRISINLDKGRRSKERVKIHQEKLETYGMISEHALFLCSSHQTLVKYKKYLESLVDKLFMLLLTMNECHLITEYDHRFRK